MVNKSKISENEKVLFHQSLYGILCTTADGAITSINQALVKWLTNSTSSDFLEDKNFINLLSPQNVDWYYNIYLPTLNNQQKLEPTKIDLLKCDGSYLPVIIEANALLNDEGEQYFLLSVIQANPLQKELDNNNFLSNKPIESIQSNHWLQAFFNYSPLPQILTFLSTGNVAMVNESLLDMLGATATDFIGKPAVGFYTNPQLRTAIINELIEKGESINKVSNFFYKERELTCLISSRLIELDGLKMILTSLVNITPNNNKDIPTPLSFEQRNIVLSSITDGFCMVNHQWEITYWNAEAVRILAIPEQVFMQCNIREIFPAIAQTNTVLHAESYYAPLKLWIQVYAYPSAMGLSVYFRDISENKKAAQEIILLNEKLAAERKLLRSIIDFLPVNVFVNDANANKILANKAEYQFLGASTEAEVLGGNQLEFYDEASIKNFQKHSQQVIRSGVPLINNESTISKIDGSKFCFLESKIPMYNDDGENTGMVGISIDITERKKMEDELKNSQQQLFLAHKAAKLGHWTYDVKAALFSFSKELYSIYGISPQTFNHTLQGLMQLVHPDDVGVLEENRRDACGNKADFNVDHRIILKDGSIKWINVRAFIERNELEQAVMLIGISQDITDRKQKESEIRQLNEALELKVIQRTSDLQRTQAMLYEAQHIAKVGSWELDLLTDKVIWSPEMFKISGFEPADNPPPTIERQQKYLAADWDKLQHSIQMAIEEGTAFEIELTIFRDNNTVGYLIAKGEPAINQSGKVVRVVGTLADITDSKTAQKMIIEQRHVFHTILEQSLAGYWDLNFQKQTCYLSPAYKALFGYHDHEIDNDNLASMHKIVFEEDRVFMEQLLVQHIQSKGVVPYNGEVRFHHKNGGTVWVICKGTIVEWDKDEQPIRMIGCHIDITKQKTTESTLEKSRNELESFSYSVSHDLRAPLRGIDGWSLALLEDYGGQLDETGKKYIASVREESQRMGNLIDDLLKLSQINRRPFKRTKVPISLLANNIAERLAASNKNRQIEFIIQPDLIVYGDARLIEILLNNIFENAVKFTAKEPAAVIQFGITIVNNSAAYFVKDNGVGFDMQTADKLFGAFQRMHSKSDFEGTGIGLATVLRIINLHSGQVWANAAVGDGATFYFIF